MEETFLVNMKSQITGNETGMAFPKYLEEKIMGWLAMPSRERPLIQDALWMLNNAQREFLITGVSPGEWDEIFAKSAKDDDQGSA